MSKRWVVLAHWRKKWKDWVKPGRYTSISLSVPGPQEVTDVPTLMLTVSVSPKHTIRFRIRDREAWNELWYISEDEWQRLTNGLKEAHAQVSEMVEDNRILEMKRRGELINSRTGEILTLAEEIVCQV